MKEVEEDEEEEEGKLGSTGVGGFFSPISFLLASSPAWQ